MYGAMAEAPASMSSSEKESERPPRVENCSSGGGGRLLSGVENVVEAEDSTQNGARSERSRNDEETLLGGAAAAAAAVEDGGSPRNGNRKACASAAHEQPRQQQQQQQLNDGLATLLPKAPEDLPLKRNFQIPRKSKEKKALFQPIIAGTREFEDVVNILHSSYLDCQSKDNFTYKIASLVHSELLEKEFTEKRRELKRDGRTEKELAESYAFLMVDRALVLNICENGLQVGHSKITVLGTSSMGIYLSRYADLLQANTLEPRATGDIIIFKVIKGKVKSIYDNLGMQRMDLACKSGLDPTPKHECHVSKSANKITSILSYRAYERTQYYFYEYGFDEIRQRPRHVCPYAVVSFSYKAEKIPKYLPQSRSKISNLDKSTDKTSYTLWKGQLLNRGTLVCHAALKSEMRPLLPCKLPEKLDVEMVMGIDHLKSFSPRVFYKESYSGEREEFRGGLYCSLYEVVEKTRSGSNLEGLLQKLERDKLVIVKPLLDRGYLLLLSPCQMASPYENQAGRPRALKALFLFRSPRGVATSTQKNEQKNASISALQETHVVMPELIRFIQSLHYAYCHSRKDPKADLNAAVEKYINDYLKRYSKHKEFVLYEYKTSLDEKRFLYSGPKNKSNLDSCLRAYIFGSEAYQIPVSKAKKIMEGNRKPQQFSPVSDYEAPEEESDFTKRKARKRNDSKFETTAKRKPKESHPRDNDVESIKELINLIQSKKKNVDRESDAEDNRHLSSLKRKLESTTESAQKHLKTSDSSENASRHEGSRTSEPLISMIADFGGHDTDLRQQNVSDPSVPDTHNIVKLLIEALTYPDSPLARIINQNVAQNNSRPAVEYNSIQPQVKEEAEHSNTVHVDSIQFKDHQSPVMLETDATCLPYSVSISEADADNVLRLKDTSIGSASSFDGCSPCPSTPIEQSYHRQHSSSNNTEETEMPWKLTPITGGAGRIPEEQLKKHGDNPTGLKSAEEMLAYSPPKGAFQNDPRVINRQKCSNYRREYSTFSNTQKGEIEGGVYTGEEEKFENERELTAGHGLTDKHPISGIIETAILEEYSLFSNKIQEILQQKNIMYVSRIPRPVFSAQEKVMRLSEYICLEASEIAVQEYIEGLSEKLNHVVALSSSYGNCNAPLICSPRPSNESVTDIALDLPSEEPASFASDLDMELCADPVKSNIVEDSSTNEQNQSVTLDTEKESSSASTTVEAKLTADSNASSAETLQQTDKTQKPVDHTNVSTQPALAAIINQLKPEVFDSIVKIIEDVRKNTVKFYIHEEHASTLCKEIKEYLIQLGSTECHPEQFLRRRADLDKLLIIIQNEDISNIIHKIPCLVTLKRLSCVNFAGVDSLDDVKNHTYNELFVSGGFIVSDESVLNPESVTVDKIHRFLKFLEEQNTPDGKWQWKVHCKIHKNLRIRANASGLLTLLNAYQKKHMVEILSYHQPCDSQSRNAADLECLINLQALNIDKRHIVFLTEKNVTCFGTYADNGIVVTTIDYFMHNFKSLVGYHNCITEENSFAPIDHERQSVFVESDQKDEEDMSLDSGDEASQIEVCNDASKYDSHLEALQIETKGSHGTGSKQNSQTVTQLTTEGYVLLAAKTSKTDVHDIKSAVPVSKTCSTEGERTKSVEQASFKNFQVYNRQLSVSHQFSHFNVLTHQTFLGTTYPIPTSQNQESGNYFLTAYSEHLDTAQTSSSSNWDVSFDSSRQYSK